MKDDFKLLEKLGEGAYSKVYRCKYDGEICAAKRIDIDKDEGVICLVELTIMSKIISSNLMRAKEIFFRDNSTYVIMDLGESILSASSLDVYEICYDIACAVRTLHENSILHFDIKPDNVIVYPNEKHGIRAVLSDYSISEKVNESLIWKGSIDKITQGYRPPEASKHIYGWFSDIYSLGMLFIWIHSFPKSKKIKFINKQAFRYIENIKDSNLKSLVSRMISKDYRERPTIHEVLSSPYFSVSRFNDSVNLIIENFEYDSKIDLLNSLVKSFYNNSFRETIRNTRNTKRIEQREERKQKQEEKEEEQEEERRECMKWILSKMFHSEDVNEPKRKEWFHLEKEIYEALQFVLF